MGYWLAIEDGFPVGTEGFDEDVFDGQGEFVVCVELAAAQGLAEVEPVGGAIAGAAEARGFAQGFQQDGPEVVAAVPVGGQAAFDLGEQGQGQAVAGVDEVAQLGAGQVLVAEIVVVVDELVPDATAGVLGAQGIETERTDLVEGVRQERGSASAACGPIAAHSRKYARSHLCKSRPASDNVPNTASKMPCRSAPHSLCEP